MSSPGSAENGRAFAQFTASVAIAVGVFVLVGWTLGLEQLTNIVPGWPRMVRMTALAFVLAGLALWLTARSRRRFAIGAAVLVTFIGALVTFRHAIGWNVYIEQLSLGPIPLGTDFSPPRMAPATSISFVLLGASLWLANLKRFAHAHQGLALVALTLGWVGLSRYIFGGEPLLAFTSMAVHTASLILLLASGALTLRTDAGIAALLASDGVGGSIARRLLPAGVLVPLAAGALATHAARRGTIDIEGAVSAFALTGAIVFVAVVWLNAARGERADRLRRQAEHALRVSEERNQLIVETALDAVVTMNAAGAITGWNTQAEKMFGWSRAEALGRALGETIVPVRLREGHREGLQRYVSSGVARVLNRRVEMSALHRDGHEFPVEVAITPIGFGDDLVFSGFIRDITGRTRTETALRESEQRFRTTANSAPVLIWMSGADKQCTWFNQRWLDFVGRSMEQEIGDGWCDNVHPADFDRTLDTYHAAFDARRSYEMEYRLQRTDGAWRWLLERGTPNIGPTGEFEGYIGTCIDITEHRETVEQLRENRARFKTLAESLPQMIWTCLRDGYCDYLSRQWLDYTGCGEAQQLGSGWLEQVHPDDRVKVQIEWARVTASGDTYDVSFRIRRFDGVYRWFKTRAVTLRDPGGRILKWFGSNTDIEDFVLAERKLKLQLERMQLLDQTTHAIGAHQDLRKVFDVVLHSLEQNLAIDFGCQTTYQSGAGTLTVAALGDRSAPLARAAGVIEQAQFGVEENALGRCLRGELMYEPDIGNSQLPFPALLAGAGLRALVAAPLTIEGEIFGVLVVARRAPDSFSSDDCEFLRQLANHVALAAHQTRLYGALQAAYQDLRESQQAVMQQERLRALGQIASGIAHDINNALSPAALYAQSMLTHESTLSERSRDQLSVIQRAIEDVARTVQRLRAFYLPRGLELTLAPVDLNQELLRVVDLTRARWSNIPQERGIVIHVESELAPDLPAILGAESEIRDALTNLLLNAVDAMPEGGTVTLRTRLDPNETEVIVEVQDTGVGMSATARNRCLEPFFTTKGERGSGLGLPMVFGVIQRHGGELEIDSEPARGTVVRLRFQRAPTNFASPGHAAAEPARALRVLLIDDDPLLLRSLRDALELDGHEVSIAEGGQAGIDAFASALSAGKTFDAVITDLGMPYVDGRKVASRVRQMSGQVPILMLTGWGHRIAVTDDKPEHVDRVLTKPPKMKELRAALAELVRPAG